MKWTLVGTALAVALCASPALAETTRTFELEGFGHFLDGNPESTAVTEDGAVALRPDVHERYADTAAAYSAAAAWGENVALARVGDAEVILVDPAGKMRSLAKIQEGVVTSMLVHQGTLLVATSAPAKILRVTAEGKTTVWSTPEVAYVWGLTAGPQDSIYAATGEPATVTRVDTAGKCSVLYEFDQSHIRSLAYHPKHGLFAGGGEHGVLYRATEEKNFRALYDTGNTEITAIVVDDRGAFIAGVSGAAQLVMEDPKKAKPDLRSQLLHVDLDGSSEVLAGSNDEAVFALALDAQNNVVVGTGATGRDDPRGRLYSIDPARRVVALLYQSPSRRITHLVTGAHQTLTAVAAAGGRLTDLRAKLAEKGEFFSAPFDAGVHSKFGLVQILGFFPAHTKVTTAMRTGQTATPDKTWSAWSAEIDATRGRSTKAPDGRYLQARLTLQGNGSLTPLVHRLRISYLRQNLPPFVRDVTVLRRGLALLPVPQEDSKSKLVMVADKSDEGHAEEPRHGNGPQRARQVFEPGALTVKWVSDDPNGDELRFDLSVKRLGEDYWRLVKQNLTEPFHTFDASQFADGYYMFRVRASDRVDNPDGQDRSDSRDSRAILIDNTPPQVSKLRVQLKGNQATITGYVLDSWGPLTELVYVLDHQDPRPILPDDGMLDGPEETLTIVLPALSPGPHQVTVRAVDDASNIGVGEIMFQVK